MTVSRRQFLTGSAAIAAGQLTTGCAFWRQPELRIQMLEGTIPVQLLSWFRTGKQGGVLAGLARRFSGQPSEESAAVDRGLLKFSPVTSPNEAFTVLQYWKEGQDAYQRGWLKLPFRSGKQPVDLITLGDAWLTGAIRQGLIQPLDTSAWSEWENLPEAWRSLVQRNSEGLMEPNGNQIWAAPYRGGSTVIAYRKNRLKQLGVEIADWTDLWDSKLKGHVSLLDAPREVIGLTLKSLGQSYNAANPGSVKGLKSKLAQLHEQVKLYSSKNYLQPLLLEDTWVAVGWSGDLLPLLQRDRNLALVYPKSGTALWADLWVHPSKAEPLQAVANDWINFCWQPDVAQLISTFSGGVSPRALVLEPPQTLEQQKAEIFWPEGDRLAQSEFIEPLPQEVLNEYKALWLKMRQGKLA